MREFFIKGKQVKPGLTITNGWCTYVVTNKYKLNYVGSGNHAEVHVSKEEMRSIKHYCVMRPFYALADAIERADRVIDRKLNGKE